MPLASALSGRDAGLSERPSEVISAVPAARSAAPVLAARILQFQASVLAHEAFDGAAAAFATEAAAMLKFDRAAIGFSRRTSVRVTAVSHAPDFQPTSALFSTFAAAMDEALDQMTTVAFPAVEGTRPLITLAHRELASRYGGSACSVPLVDRGKTFGALTLARAGTGSVSKEEIALCEHLVSIVGPILKLKWESERPWHERLRRSLGGAVQYWASPGHYGAKAAACVALATLCAALLIPVQYRVGAPARLEGSVQRALVAPAAGFVRKIHARPGDRVKAGQVLAELADDEMRLERRRWESELTQYENTASAAIARGDRAQFAIHEAKADEARAQLDLVDAHLARTQVVAPFDGVVIKGDLSQSIGAPVQRGEILLVVAPAESFRLMIDVDERDISAVSAGQHGQVALTALPDRVLAFRVEKVTPVAQTRDGRNAFEVEGALEGSFGALRPGLQGVAKIDAGERALAWIWTHRVLAWMRLKLWSLGM
jgi:multidrug efflux pump subunit AcrA (membrane-fusion protein)